MPFDPIKITTKKINIIKFKISTNNIKPTILDTLEINLISSITYFSYTSQNIVPSNFVTTYFTQDYVK